MSFMDRIRGREPQRRYDEDDRYVQEGDRDAADRHHVADDRHTVPEDRDGTRDDRRAMREDHRRGQATEAAGTRENQHDRYGGLNWGAAFFGWLVAVGMAVLLTALVGAAGTTVAIFEIDSPGEAVASADTISLAGGIALLVIALVAYFAGGYVAGRMSRFDGARQGFGVWVWAIVVTLVLALIGAIAGEEWNIFAGLDLPRLPIDEDTTTGGLILLAALALGTVLAAVAGGKAGEQYHRRVDRVGPEGRHGHRVRNEGSRAERTV